MRLNGIRTTDYINFEPLEDISRNTFLIEASLGGHCVQDDLPLFAVDSFCALLRTFVATRNGEPILEGAYDFLLSFHTDHYGTSAWAKFYMAKFIMQDDGDYGRIAVSGGFPVRHPELTTFADSFHPFRPIARDRKRLTMRSSDAAELERLAFPRALD